MKAVTEQDVDEPYEATAQRLPGRGMSYALRGKGRFLVSGFGFRVSGFWFTSLRFVYSLRSCSGLLRFVYSHPKGTRSRCSQRVARALVVETGGGRRRAWTDGDGPVPSVSDSLQTIDGRKAFRPYRSVGAGGAVVSHAPLRPRSLSPILSFSPFPKALPLRGLVEDTLFLVTEGIVALLADLIEDAVDFFLFAGGRARCVASVAGAGRAGG